MGVAPRQHHQRLDEVGLAGGVGSDDDLWPARELDLQLRVAAEAGERQALDTHGAAAREAPQDGVRTGMITWT